MPQSGCVVHEGDHPRQALFFGIEIHVGVKQQDVFCRGGLQHPIEIRGIMQALGVMQDDGIRKILAIAVHAVFGIVIDQNQAHAQTVARGLQRRQQGRHQIAFVGIDHADVEIRSCLRQGNNVGHVVHYVNFLIKCYAAFRVLRAFRWK